MVYKCLPKLLVLSLDASQVFLFGHHICNTGTFCLAVRSQLFPGAYVADLDASGSDRGRLPAARRATPKTWKPYGWGGSTGRGFCFVAPNSGPEASGWLFKFQPPHL